MVTPWALISQESLLTSEDVCPADVVRGQSSPIASQIEA